MSAIIVHGDTRGAYLRTVRMTSAEKGVGHILEAVDLPSDAYAATHPFPRMPAPASQGA